MTTDVDTAANPEMAPQDDKAVDSKATDTKATDAADTDADTKAGTDTKATDADTKVAAADDWRVKLAGGDEKELKRLGRFATEADVYKAYRELEKKKSSGELVTKLSKDATPEELTQWRKDNGIPESADKYDLSFDNGLVIGEEDKPLIDKFVTKMHGENATPSQVKAALASYYDIVAEQQRAIAEKDVEFKSANEEALREEWGGEYKKNLNAVNGLLSSMPEDVREYFDNARAPSGNALGSDANVLKWLASVAYEINPAATVMPSSMSNPSGAISDEIKAIEKIISSDKADEYWKDQKMQDRYAQLMSAQQKINNRG